MANHSGGRSPSGDAAGEEIESLQSQRSDIDSRIQAANAKHDAALKKQVEESDARVAELETAIAKERQAHADNIKSLQSMRDTKVAALQQKAAQLDDQIQARMQDEEHRGPSVLTLESSPANQSIGHAPSIAVGAAQPHATAGVAGNGAQPVASLGEGVTSDADDRIHTLHRQQRQEASGEHGTFTALGDDSSDSDDGAAEEPSQQVAGGGEGTARAFPGIEEPYIHEHFTMVIEMDGGWHELKCFICGANIPQDNDDFFQGASGLLKHLKLSADHETDLERDEFLRKCSQRVFGPTDVAELKAGRQPATPILKTLGDGTARSFRDRHRTSVRTGRNHFGNQSMESAASSQDPDKTGALRGDDSRSNGMKRKRAPSLKINTCDLEKSAPRTSKSANYGPDVLLDDCDPDTAFHPYVTEPPTPQFNLQTFLNIVPDKRARTAPSGAGDFANRRSKGISQESHGAGMNGAAVATAAQAQYDTDFNSIRGPESNELYPTYGHAVSSTTARRADVKQNEVLRKHQENGDNHTAGASTAQHQRDMIQLPSLRAVAPFIGDESYLSRRSMNSVKLSGAWHIIRCKICYANAKKNDNDKLVHFCGIRELREHVERSHPETTYDDLDSWCDYQKLNEEIVRRATDRQLDLRGLPFRGNFRTTGKPFSRAANEEVMETRERTDTLSPNAARQSRDPYNLPPE